MTLSAACVTGEFCMSAKGIWIIVRGWVYNGFSCTVVERDVVASVMMITIDKEYWSGVSN